MRLTYNLPILDSSRESLSTKSLIELSRHAEKVGIDAVSVTDHPFPVTAASTPGHQAHDPFVVLSLIAAVTTKLRLQFSLIVLPYRSPFVTARSLSTLDLVSRGRVTAGIGAGYMKAEFEALGAQFEDRNRQVAEDVAAMRHAWTGKELYAETDRWKATGNSMRPLPYTPSGPPLWRGGNSKLAIDQAVKLFDGWFPLEIDRDRAPKVKTAEMTVKTLPEKIRYIKEQREALGKTGPFDICFARSAPGRLWLKDAARAVDEFGLLAEMGVTWVEVGTTGTELEEIRDELDNIVELAKASGVHG